MGTSIINSPLSPSSLPGFYHILTISIWSFAVVSGRKGEDNWLIITLVPKDYNDVLLFVALILFFSFGWFIKFIVLSYQSWIDLQKGFFVCVSSLGMYINLSIMNWSTERILCVCIIIRDVHQLISHYLILGSLETTLCAILVN